MQTAENIYKESASYTVGEIMAFMTHDSLLKYKKKHSRAAIDEIRSQEVQENNSPYKKGVVFVSPCKEDLVEGKGFVVTSYETLAEKNERLTHWTPNTYRYGTYKNFSKRIIKGHSRDNLKQINVYGFDIDSKAVDLYNLYLGCEELGLPRPNLLLETPRGYQFFFVLKTPFFIHNNNDYKALRVAEKIHNNLSLALSKYIAVDTACVPFGFYRIPRVDNVIDFYNVPTDTKALLAWSMEYEKNEKKHGLFVVHNKHIAAAPSKSEWYHKLINAQHIEKGHHSSSRNNALFTLALANYSNGISFEEAYDELDQFNSNLESPLSKNEFERVLKSAYSNKYKGVKRRYAESLLELWTDGKTSFTGQNGWHKFKKDREDRVRSHYSEWESDIINKLNTLTSPEQPFLEGSLKMLAETLEVPLSSFKEVLKRSRCKLIKHVCGKGRSAYTKITTVIMFARYKFNEMKEKKKATKEALVTALNAGAQNLILFPKVHEEYEVIEKREIEFLYRTVNDIRNMNTS